MKFITFIIIHCMGGICTNPSNNFEKVTIQIDTISSIENMQYFWYKDGTVTHNGDFIPNKNATKMNGCYINIKNSSKFYSLELPCDNIINELKKCN